MERSFSCKLVKNIFGNLDPLDRFKLIEISFRSFVPFTRARGDFIDAF